MTNDLLIGCGQITWPRSLDLETILSEIAQAGYIGAPASPGMGSPAETTALFERHGLKPAPGYMGVNFWDPTQTEKILKQAATMARFMAAVGCSELYVADSGFNSLAPSGKTRKEVAGHVSPADALPEDRFRYFADTLNQVGRITLDHGVRACFHNHVGSFIETRAELDRLFDLVDREVVFMGPDTGHLAWGGVDVVDCIRAYAPAVKTIHIKDINQEVMEAGRAAKWPYDTFSANGVFTELGQGFVDFPAIFNILKAAGFSGWIIVETDVTQLPSALESATISRKYLKQLGF